MKQILVINNWSWRILKGSPFAFPTAINFTFTRSFISSLLNWKSSSHTSPTALLRVKGKGTNFKRKGFVDKARIQVYGGKGGDGCVSLLKIFANEFAGPDGGDGGNGGHVLFKASHNVRDLADIPPIIKGKDGEKGMNDKCDGRNAETVIYEVPFGTVFKSEDGLIMADLSSADECVFLAARGGSGGRGNRFFVTAVNQAPEVAEFGAEGEFNTYILELSTIAHVGLVGYPNAGKSTLLQAISRARPKIAPYPFTTLGPQVGMVHYDDYEQVAVADIPGVIEDAHKNRGLGIDFLRHIQRCLCLVYVIDLASDGPIEQLETLYNELDCFDPNLRKKPFIVVGNKIDLPESKQNYSNLKQYTEENGVLFVPISGKNCTNLKPLLQKIREFYDTEGKRLTERYSLSREAQSQNIDVSSWKRTGGSSIQDSSTK